MMATIKESSCAVHHTAASYQQNSMVDSDDCSLYAQMNGRILRAQDISFEAPHFSAQVEQEPEIESLTPQPNPRLARREAGAAGSGAHASTGRGFCPPPQP